MRVLTKPDARKTRKKAGSRKVRESAIQTYIINAAKELSAFAFKVTSPSRRGIPDVCVLFRGYVFFVEVKAGATYRCTSIQTLTHKQMRAAGGMVSVVSGLTGANHFLDYLRQLS